MPSYDLQEAEERYRRLVEYSPDGICISHEGRIVFANGALARMLGANDVSEILGRTYREAIHPDSLLLVEERMAQVIAGEFAPWIEEKWFRLDGSVVHVEAAAVPIVLRGEVLVHLFTRDLTERKRAEEALEEQRQRLQALFDLSIDAIILIDDEGRYVDVNPAATKLFGYSREEPGSSSGAAWPPASRRPSACAGTKGSCSSRSPTTATDSSPAPTPASASPACTNG